MSNRFWILLFAGLIAIFALLTLLPQKDGDEIGIWQGGELLYTINPGTVKEPYTLTLSSSSGEAQISVSAEGVQMLSSNCRSRLCVRHGLLKKGGSPIVCLPQRIVIRYMDTKSSADAVVG